MQLRILKDLAGQIVELRILRKLAETESGKVKIENGAERRWRAVRKGGAKRLTVHRSQLTVGDKGQNPRTRVPRMRGSKVAS